MAISVFQFNKYENLLEHLHIWHLIDFNRVVPWLTYPSLIMFKDWFDGVFDTMLISSKASSWKQTKENLKCHNYGYTLCIKDIQQGEKAKDQTYWVC